MQKRGSVYKKTVFWVQQGNCIYESIVAETAHTTPLQGQDRQNPRTENGGGHEVLPLAKELLVVGGF